MYKQVSPNIHINKKNYHITKLYLFVILLRNCEGLYSEGLYSYKYKPKCATKESISDS